MKLVRTKAYVRALKRLKVSDRDIDAAEQAVADNPLTGDLIKGTGGARKLRFRIGSRGKSHGGRTIYYAAVTVDLVYLLYAYAKSDQDDLTGAQRNTLKSLIGELRRELDEDMER